MGLEEYVRLRTAATEAREAPLGDLLARESIRDLGALYAMAVDTHDLGALRLMFHPDVELDRDGELARGRDEVLALLQASMSGFRRMVHTPETHVVHVEGDHASGIATAHAELVTGRGVVLAAHEYEDGYRVHDGRWVFTRRSIRFVYATRAADYSSTLSGEDRIRLPGEPPRAMRGGWSDPPSPAR